MGIIYASNVADYLAECTRLLAEIVPAEIEFVCISIVVHGKRIGRKQRMILNKHRIKFRKKNMSVKTTYCNKHKNLSNALSGWI